MPDGPAAHKYLPDRAIYRPITFGVPAHQLRGLEAQISVGLQVLADRANKMIWRDLQVKYGLSKQRLSDLAKLACRYKTVQCAVNKIDANTNPILNDKD